MKLRTVRLGISVVIVMAAAAFLVVSSGAAARPTITKTPVETTFLDEIDCSFPVEAYIKGTDTAITRVVQGDVHEFHAFAGGHPTLTNLDTHTSITINIAGRNTSRSVRTGASSSRVRRSSYSRRRPTRGEEHVRRRAVS